MRWHLPNLTKNTMASTCKTALVLCGGGSQGAAEVGLYRAMLEQDIQPDFILGSSVGAINGAFIASGMSPGQLKKLWLEISRRSLYRMNPQLFWKWRKAPGLFKPTGLRQFLNERLPVKSFEELAIPLTVVATDLQKAEPVYLESGPLLPALMASCAIPLFFPPQQYEGKQLVDGGVTNNVPVNRAVHKGAGRIYGILCECMQDLEEPVEGFLQVFMRSMQVNLRQRIFYDLNRYGGKCSFYLIDLCINTRLTHMLDFSKTETVMEESYRHAKSVLARQLSTGQSGILS